MIISVASGKGGTGKTTVATNLALSLSHVTLLDCDVEEPDTHIFIKPTIIDQEKVYIPVPEIDTSRCTYCGKCREVCAYHAIAIIAQQVLVFNELCHGCGACSYFCPTNAITEVKKEIGVIERGKKNTLTFVHGRLNIGEPMAPPLIRAVKQRCDAKELVIIDAPPGTSCPAITAVKDSDFCILVTEPTPFGLHDLTLAVEVVRKLAIPCGIVINRYGLGNDEVEHYCIKENIPILMTIPFQKDIAIAYSNGESIIDVLPEYEERFITLYEKCKQLIKSKVE